MNLGREGSTVKGGLDSGILPLPPYNIKKLYNRIKIKEGFYSLFLLFKTFNFVFFYFYNFKQMFLSAL
uniref:Uncharacterized protein n=1 Tax=Staphylococcus phage 184DA TaxID=3110532 RepID=A0AAU6MXN0_9CAUD